MSDISEMRDNLGVKELDKASREKLLKDFKKAGGVVLDDEPHPFVVDKEKQKEWLANNQFASNKSSSQEEKSDALWKYESIDLWTYLAALWHGVISFSGKFVRRSFFYNFQKNIFPILRHSAVIISNIFQIDLDYGRKIETQVREKNNNGFDILEKYRDLYSENLFAEFLQPEVLQKRVYVRSKLFTVQVSDLLKKIYILKPYKESLISAIRVALEYQDLLLNVKKAQTLIFVMEQEINIVFDIFFKKLFYLFEIMTGHKYNLDSDDLNEVLGISPLDAVGYFVEKKSDKETDESIAEQPKENVDEPVEQDDKKEILEKYSDEEADRIRCLSNIPFNEWVVILTQKKKVFINFNDKAFVLYIMMLEFEEEYSFILSSSKIKINMVYSNNAKIDYRNMLNNLYVRLDNILDSFKSYFEIVKDMRLAHELDEVEMFNRMQVLDEKKRKVFRSISMEIFHFFQELTGIMGDFIKNLSESNDTRKIIENPDEVVTFDSSIEGYKKMNNYKIFDILKNIHLFSESILFELDDSGVLSGDEPELQTDYLDTVRLRQKTLLAMDESISDEPVNSEEKSSKENFSVDNLEDMLK